MRHVIKKSSGELPRSAHGKDSAIERVEGENSERLPTWHTSAQSWSETPETIERKYPKKVYCCRVCDAKPCSRLISTSWVSAVWMCSISLRRTQTEDLNGDFLNICSSRYVKVLLLTLPSGAIKVNLMNPKQTQFAILELINRTMCTREEGSITDLGAIRLYWPRF